MSLLSSVTVFCFMGYVAFRLNRSLITPESLFGKSTAAVPSSPFRPLLRCLEREHLFLAMVVVPFGATGVSASQLWTGLFLLIVVVTVVDGQFALVGQFANTVRYVWPSMVQVTTKAKKLSPVFPVVCALLFLINLTASTPVCCRRSRYGTYVS